MDHIGIDVHKKESQLCILSEDGQRREPRVRTTLARFADVLGDRPRARILLEASTESEWVTRCLERLGHEVIVADPNFAPMYATRTRKIKTDRRDARALAEVARGRPARQGSERACCWSMKMSPHGDMGDIPHEPKRSAPAWARQAGRGGTDHQPGGGGGVQANHPAVPAGQAPAETEWLEPNSAYAMTKASATPFCRLTAQRQGLRMATLRLYSVYGPFEEPDRLLPTLVLRGLDGDLPPLVDPDVARDYVHVDDVCEAYRLAAASHPAPEPRSVYNVGTGIQTKLREVVDVARRALPIAVEPRWGSMPRRGWDTGVWLSDSRRIRAELGWHPASSL